MAEPLTMQTRILFEGWDGKECFVHARIASSHDGRLLITTQKFNTAGCDYFYPLHTDYSADGGKSWTGCRPDAAFEVHHQQGIRSVCCDMTPFYHQKTGKFLVTGHIAQYREGELTPLEAHAVRRVTPYAVFDEQKGCFGPVRQVQMPDSVLYRDCGSGCSQCCELDNGDMLIPISYQRPEDERVDARVAVMRCGFDGETITCLAIGNELTVPGEVRGIGEASVIALDGRWFLTIRGDTYGYVSVSTDGVHYTAPAVWRWEDGEPVPTYNTQSHFFTVAGRLYLVYTRRAENNGHVFRHRAPLFVAEVDPMTLRLKRETECIAVPERGARLGNFGVCRENDRQALILAAEWMQPAGYERYGSDNAVWLTTVSAREE